MRELIQTTFHGTFASIEAEIALMPLSRWNESVLRYFFCREMAKADSEVEQFVECGRIDLVLRQPPLSAFIEFKFYVHHRRFDPYERVVCGFKGGPGPKNRKEFASCIDQLHGRKSAADLSKYVILVYADLEKDGVRQRFADSYGNYRHRGEAPLRLLETRGPIHSSEGIICGQLYEIEG